MSLSRCLVAAGERAQPAAEVVVQHERPAAEELLGQELREHAVARLVVPRRCGRDRRCCRAARTPRSCRKNRARRAAPPTAGNQSGQLRGTAGASSAQASCRSTSRRSASRIAGGSSSWSARPVRCCSSLTAFSVCRMLSAAESTWLLRKSGILPVDRHLGERLNLSFDAIELDR